MKTLLILLLIPTLLFSQEKKIFGIDENKFNHAYCGAGIGFVSNAIAYELSKNKTVGLVSGIVVSSLAGHLKEKYDAKNGKSYNRADVRYTILGGLGGSITLRLVLWNSVHRKKYIEKTNI